MKGQISEIGVLLLFLVGGLMFVCISLFISKLIRPNRPNWHKNTAYECGEEPSGNAWGRFNIRFYAIAVLFLLFEIELVFLFPWAVVFGNKALLSATQGQWAWLAFVEIIVFVGILTLGLVYAWRFGYLNWYPAKIKTPSYKKKIPDELYHQINEKYQ